MLSPKKLEQIKKVSQRVEVEVQCKQVAAVCGLEVNSVYQRLPGGSGDPTQSRATGGSDAKV